MANLDISAPLKELTDKIEGILALDMDDPESKAWGFLEPQVQKNLKRLGIEANEFATLFAPLSKAKADPTFNYNLDEWEHQVDEYSLSGKFGMDLQVDVVLPNDDEQYLAFKSGNLPLVVFGYDLSIGAGAGASLPIKLVTIEASASGELDWGVKVITSVGEDKKLSSLMAKLGKTPLDLFDIHTLSSNLSKHYSAFEVEGVIIEQQRGLSLKGNATLGYAWSKSGTGKAIGIEANAGASLGTEYVFKGKFGLVIAPTERGVRIEINQLTDTSKEINYSLDALVKISGVDNAARAYLEPPLTELSGSAKKLKTLLDKYSSPSSWLTNQLSAHLAELAEDDTNPLLSVAQSLAIGNAEGIDSSVQDYLEERLTDVLDSQHLDWLTDDSAAAESTAKDITNSLGLSSKVIDKLKLNEHLTKQIVKANAKLKEEINELAGDAGAETKKQFAKVLQQIDGAKDKLDAAGGDITATLSTLVSEWLTLYDQAASKFTATVKKLSSVELGLSLYGAKSNNTQHGAMLSFELLQTNVSAVQEFYVDLLLGKAIDIERLLHGDLKPYVANLSGWFEQTYKSQSTLGLGLSLGDDFQFAQAKTLVNIANAKVDKNGLLLAANSNIAITDNSTTLKEVRSTELLGAFDVFAAIKLGAKPNISFDVSFEDSNVMTTTELSQFLTPLEEQGLIHPLDAADIQRKYAQVVAAGQAKRSLIECGVNLSKREIESIISTSPEKLRELALEKLYEVYLQPVEIEIIESRSSMSEPIVTQLETFARKGLIERNQKHQAHSTLPRKVKSMIRNAEALSKVPGYYQQMVREITPLTSNDPNSYIEIINSYNDKIIDALKYFVEARGAITGLITEKLPRPTQVLLLVIAELIERGEPVLTTTLSYDVDKQTKRL